VPRTIVIMFCEV